VIAYIDQAGSRCLTRLYIKDDPKQVEMAQTLAEYVTQIVHFDRTVSGKGGRVRAQPCCASKPRFAKAEMDRTLRRDPKKPDTR